MADPAGDKSGNQDHLTPARRRLLVAVSILLGFLVVEAASYAILVGFVQERRYNMFYYDYTDYVARISDKFLTDSRPHFDPDLGWNTVPGKQYPRQHNCAGQPWTHGFEATGSRNNPYSSSDPLISLYGGSYTLSEEVNDDQTWQYFLSQSMETKVLNFGVGGYGPDQAFLKLKRNVERGVKTPVMVLGLYSAGIHRVVNAYRPYYGFGTGLKLGFKPVLVERNGAFEWAGLPIDSLDDRAAIAEAAIAARQDDYWFHYNLLRPKLRFPYTLAAIHTAYFISRYYAPRRNFWEAVPRARDATAEILRQFVILSKREDFTPVVVFLPESGELQYYQDGKPAKYEKFKQQITKTYSPSELIVVDVYDEKFDPEQFMTMPGCHPAEYGTRIIAGAVSRAIAGRITELKSR